METNGGALLQDVETHLMQQLDERILQAEELDMMERYNNSIATAEQQQESAAAVVNDDGLWSDIDRVGEQVRRPSKRLDAEDDFEGLDPTSVEGMEYVRATKLVPRRYLGDPGATRQELEHFIEKKFRKDSTNRLRPVHWMGFRIRLESANPNSWRLVVTGYRQTVDLLLVSLERIFKKRIVAAMKKNAPHL
jgi:hypothetical protein